MYGKADRGEIVGLIGYSASNPYEVPMDADITLDTSSSVTLDSSAEAFVRYIRIKTLEAKDLS